MTVPVESFPLPYDALRTASWMRCAVVGGACNVGSALLALGDEARLCTLIGEDIAGDTIRNSLRQHGLDGRGVVTSRESAMTVVLVEPEGRVARNAWSAGGSTAYPMERFFEAAVDADLAIITSSPFGKPFLSAAREIPGLPVAIDLHLAANLDDERNRPWFESADVLFCSHERLTCTPTEWISRVLRTYPGCRVAAVGRGDQGCALGLPEGTLIEIEAVTPRPIRSTDGAGDALFAAFLHGWLTSGRAVESLESAVLFAGWKIGAESATAGFLTPSELSALQRVYPLRTRVGWWR
ncbi:carbohydrate kinase family protein [Actinacidiphila yeochonensis]|uniref:carbohydrate kinase family protein n=1 Tax=Actinacidiphila yeochonensis TaxID=89050 RepID=UPI000690A168|nr:carbohydrate kinase family protein [Actinacidiphila yeochonensis]